MRRCLADKDTEYTALQLVKRSANFLPSFYEKYGRSTVILNGISAILTLKVSLPDFSFEFIASLLFLLVEKEKTLGIENVALDVLFVHYFIASGKRDL